MDGNRRVELRVMGRVQGVFYRVSTRQEGMRLGLTGWVRNLEDGSVEVAAEGPGSELESLVAWCRRGPPQASVTEVRVKWSDASGEFTDFEIRRL